MGKTLPLSECLLAMGRELHEQGRGRDALKLFTRLVTFRDLTPAVSEEAHSRLAELLLAEKQYKAARRHLSVLMCYRPGEAKYFYQFALALHRDTKADPNRAVKYYQTALDIDPAQPRRWASYGKLLIDLGRTPEAVAALQQAYELAPGDAVVVGRYVEALCLDERADDARRILRLARFAHPRDARFRKLWNDFQYRRIADEQGRPRADEPVLLPFVRRAAIVAGPRPTPGIIKLDEVRPAKPEKRLRFRRGE